MSLHIMRCPVCRTYTMRDRCGCGETTFSIKPPKYSPADKYSKYRRMAKKRELQKKGLL